MNFMIKLLQLLILNYLEMTAEIETGTVVTNEIVTAMTVAAIVTETTAAVTVTGTTEVTGIRAAVTEIVMTAAVVATMNKSHNLNVTTKMRIIMRVTGEAGTGKNRRGGMMIMMMTVTDHQKRSHGGTSLVMMMTTTGQARKRTGTDQGLGHGHPEERIGQGPGVVNVTDPKKETKIMAVTDIIGVQQVLEEGLRVLGEGQAHREMLEWTIWKRESWMVMGEAKGVQITEVGAAA